MQEGSDFLKVRSYARQFRRLYKLNETLTAISWYPTSKKPSKATSSSEHSFPIYHLPLLLFFSILILVTIDSIKEIRLGKTTERLREYAHQFQDESIFSIIYTNGSHENVSLDLVASSADEANIWVTGLSCLIANHGAPLSTAGTDLRAISFRFTLNMTDENRPMFLIYFLHIERNLIMIVIEFGKSAVEREKTELSVR